MDISTAGGKVEAPDHTPSSSASLHDIKPASAIKEEISEPVSSTSQITSYRIVSNQTTVSLVDSSMILLLTDEILEPPPTGFSKLPPEIRVMIWKATFPGPRLVRVTLRVPVEGEQNQEWRHVSRCYFPIALWINRESRWEALKKYELAFPFTMSSDIQEIIRWTRMSPDGLRQRLEKHPQTGHTARTYIDFNLDSVIFTVWRGGSEYYNYVPTIGLEKLRHLVVFEERVRSTFRDLHVLKFIATFEGEVLFLRQWKKWTTGLDTFEILPYAYTISMKPDDDKEFTDLEVSETGRKCNLHGDKLLINWRQLIELHKAFIQIDGPKDISKPLLTFGLRNRQDHRPHTWKRKPSQLIPKY